MLGVTLASLRAHAVRFVLTGVVVMLSVGFTAGTLALSDSLGRVGVDEVAATARGVDLSVLSSGDHAGFTAADLDAMKAIEGVDSLVPRAEVGVHGTDADGRVDEGIWLRAIAVPPDEVAAGVVLTDGRLPRRGDEAVLDVNTAERAEVGVGDTYSVAPMGADPMTFTVVGVARRSVIVGSLVGTTYETVTGIGADIRRVDVVLGDSADPSDAAAALANVSQAEVATGAELTQRLVAESTSLAKALRTPLLVLGAVAVIVAAFVIANTFRILVAQRTRELALLRAIGATRRQVRRGVLVESLVVGVIGSVVGFTLGVGGAAAIAVPIMGGADLTVVVSTTTIGWSLAIGVAVTVGAAWVPARAATRVSPLAALRTAPDGTDDARTGRIRRAIGVVLIVGGAGILGLIAAFADSMGELGIVVVVLGATVVGIGILVLGPVIMPPLVGLGGRLARAAAGRRQRATLELATVNALRHPRRVSATSGALLIGVTVVVGFAVMATSARAAANMWADDNVPADITVSLASTVTGDESIPADVISAIERATDVRVAVPIRTTFAEAGGTPDGFVDINGLDLERFGTLTDTEQVLPGDGEALLDEQTAAYGDIEPGDTVTVTDAHGDRHDVTVVDLTRRAGRGLTLAEDRFRRWFPDAGVTMIAVDAVDGADVETVRSGIVDRTAGHIDLAVRNADDARDDAMAQFDRAIGVALAVLALAVVIAVIGIGNTMSLAVHERTREIGLLRALGLTRRQTRAMLGAEAVMISAAAGVLGVIIALAFSWVAVRSLPGMTLTVPWVGLAAAIVTAGVLGWLAALIPARRAARTSPVVALAAH